MRYEMKFLLTERQYYQIRAGIARVMDEDKNNVNGGYRINSLYFDDVAMHDYYASMSGVRDRKKHRLRYYNDHDSVIRFEKKMKSGSRSGKKTFLLKKDDCLKLLNMDYGFLLDRGDAEKEAYFHLQQNLIRPKILIVYDREAFVLPYDDTRITFDNNVRANSFLNTKDHQFFRQDMHYFFPDPMYSRILEVKYQHFLPNFIKNILNGYQLTQVSVSKYVLCTQLMQQRI